MVTQELLDFIKKAKGAGKTNDQISLMLIQSGGWASADIAEGFKELGISEAPPAVPQNPIPSAPVPNAINRTPPPSAYINPKPNLQPNIPPSSQPNPQPNFQPTINPQPIANQQNQTPLSNFPPRMQPIPVTNFRPISTARPAPAKSKKSKGPMIMAIIILLFLAIGAAAYFFRDDLKTLPGIRDLFPAPAPAVTQPIKQPVAQPVTQPVVQQVVEPATPTPPVVDNTASTNTTVPANTNSPTTIQPGSITTGSSSVTSGSIKTGSGNSPANPNCVLSTNYSPELTLHEGSTLINAIEATNFSGKASQVSWVSQDVTTVTVSPATGDGSTASIKGLKPGSTEIVITDNAIGKDCTVPISVDVTK